MTRIKKDENVERKYSIGLDIGTSSVGWAVMYNDNFKIMKRKKNKLWGVRLFKPADTAAQKRLYRSTKRRYDRRRERIKLLQEIFHDEIIKVDKDFYQKLQESFYNKKDAVNKKIKITDEEKSLIKKYNSQCPTIYHLRNYLMTSKEKAAIRLVYLALHHIIKYRGNFLYGSGDFNVENLLIADKLQTIFENLSLTENFGFNEINVSDIDYLKFEQALLNNSKKDKELLIKEVFKDFDNKNFINEFTKLMIGNKANLVKMFGVDSDSKVTISFKGTDYEDKYGELEKLLKEQIEIVQDFKELYDMVFLKSLFKGSKDTNISALMISRYDKHKEDLRFLKDLLKYNETEYSKVLRTNEKYVCLYEQYINNKITYQDFILSLNKCIEKILPDVSDKALTDLYYNEKSKEILNEEFLPRITNSDNGKYPYQLNKKELDLIIENQGKYYPFLKEKIADTYKIEKLLTFRIPYYVGPLNNTTKDKNIKNPNAWMERKTDDVKITPYNFEEVVDLDSSAEKFITRMISNCTYIINEPSMPTNSILYSKYKVYNELKQIKVNNKKLTSDMTNQIYNDLFLRSASSITNKTFTNYLKTLPEYSMEETFNITGYSALNKFANSMKSYVDFFGPNEIFFNTNYNVDDAEEIISWITIFEDKDILERKVRAKYTDLSERQIRKILSKKYRGWSRLSRKLLETKYYIDKETTLKKSIMDLLTETNKNFMQIINDKKYNFQKMIDSFNKLDDTSKLNYSVVADLSTPPAIKRGIYQSLKIVRELVDYIGYEPENIMIEMARGDDKKGRTQSRKNQLLDYYKKAKDGIDNYNRLFKELKETEESAFNNEKLYLYFLQEAKSLYSREPLNIDELDKYEIDHIIPRTLIKDDSFDNKALVLKSENQAKAASFTLPDQFRINSNVEWWQRLKKNNMMSERKFNNLKRHKYSKEDIEGFINRQIVETRQITKHVANILNNYYQKTKVIYLKASFSNDFRQKFELFKYRDLNDFHHAHDAYLASALGYYKEKFYREVDFETLRKANYESYQSGRYKYDQRYGYVINNIDPEVPLYDRETVEILIDNKEFINAVTKTLYNSDILVSRKTEIATGQFYEQNISKKGTKAAPLKDNLPTELYGGYSGVNSSYAVIVNFVKKNKEIQKMIGVPIYIDKLNDEEAKMTYIRKMFNLDEDAPLKIVKDRIPFYVVLDLDGQICSLSGANETIEVWNAKQFIVDKKHLEEWRYTLNRLFNGKQSARLSEELYNKQLSEIIIYINEKVKQEYKLYHNLLEKMMENFKIDNIENLTTLEKQIIIVQMLKLLKCSSDTANLKALDSKLSSSFGRKNQLTISHGKIIFKSITGLKEDVYEF